MYTVLDLILKAFLGACGGGMLTLILLCIKYIWQKMKADSKTMRALAQDAYLRQARELLLKDKILEEELEDHNVLYEAYKAQKLNGTGDQIHNKILQKGVIPTGTPIEV